MVSSLYNTYSKRRPGQWEELLIVPADLWDCVGQMLGELQITCSTPKRMLINVATIKSDLLKHV
jgi:hypothetical protein